MIMLITVQERLDVEFHVLSLVVNLPQLTGHRRSRGARSHCSVLAMDILIS